MSTWSTLCLDDARDAILRFRAEMPRADTIDIAVSASRAVGYTITEALVVRVLHKERERVRQIKVPA